MEIENADAQVCLLSWLPGPSMAALLSEHMWHWHCSAHWRSDMASAELDPLQTLSLPSGLVHPGWDCDLRLRPSLSPLPFLGERGIPASPLWRGWRQKAGGHLPSLPAAKCSLYPFSCYGLTQAPWRTLAQVAPDSFPQACSLEPQAPTPTWALSQVLTLFPEVFNGPAQSGFPLRAKAFVLLFPRRKLGLPAYHFFPLSHQKDMSQSDT